jgi:transcriptional regulator with PAS, ATPase and Fis domain
LVSRSAAPIHSYSEVNSLKESTKAFQKRLIEQVIQKFGNTLEGKRKASQVLGISLSSLYQKLDLKR